MRRSGRQTSFRLLWMIAALLVLVCLAGTATADKQDEARSMLGMINAFRTGSEAWYWNQDNRTYTMENGLGKLAYDYELEEVAKIRAEEISRVMGHTRPDGSQWSTAFPKGNYYKGENLARGYETAAEAFEGFKETNQNYNGQGHRRNMLRRQFTRVGFAAVTVNGIVYWVQEFASGPVVKASPDKGKTGWAEYSGKYYYRNADGTWATGWIQDGGEWYFLDGSGAMKTGWVYDAGSWYYMNKNGAMKTGWLRDGGDWYYLKKTGAMATGRCTVDGQVEIFSASGVWQYSEIPDYDTPLGGGPLVWLLRTVRQVFMNLFTVFE